MNLNEDTEFNDALRKHGILPPREPTPPTPPSSSSPTLEDQLARASVSELKDIEDDANDSESEKIVASYRARRLAELRKQGQRARFGEVYPISREDYNKEVTEASKADTPGEMNVKGTGVVCCLYKDSQIASTRVLEQLKELARRHPQTKFVSIIGNKCIANYADNLCPTLIIYRNGEVTRQIVAWGGDREKSIAELEAILILSLAIISSPKSFEEGRSGSENDSDDARQQAKLSKPKLRQSNITKSDDSDSDFDL